MCTSYYLEALSFSSMTLHTDIIVMGASIEYKITLQRLLNQIHIATRPMHCLQDYIVQHILLIQPQSLDSPLGPLLVAKHVPDLLCLLLSHSCPGDYPLT
jgi:hypothetical protein